MIPSVGNNGNNGKKNCYDHTRNVKENVVDKIPVWLICGIITGIASRAITDIVMRKQFGATCVASPRPGTLSVCISKLKVLNHVFMPIGANID